MAPKLNGYIPEPVSPKHRTFDALRPNMLARLPAPVLSLGDVDLRQYTSARQDQKSLGSCSAQAVVKALEIKRIQKHGRSKHVDLSILALYYLARELMNPPTTHLDGGAYISHACDVLRRWGICEESIWPYAVSKFAVAPPWKAMRRAYVNKIDSFNRITGNGDDRITDILIHLHSGNPVVYGTSVDKAFLSLDSNTVVGALKGKAVGRHAMTIVGHVGGLFIIENSWGRNWGSDGFFKATSDHLTDPEVQDIWTITGGWEDWTSPPAVTRAPAQPQPQPRETPEDDPCDPFTHSF